MAQTIDCVVVDAGARYGLHPTWADLRHVARFHLFEMDPNEARRLELKYSKDVNVIVHPIALFSENTSLSMMEAQHRGLNSTFDVNFELLNENEYMVEEFSTVAQSEVQARKIDTLFAEEDVHFLKLDVEGAELEVLKGAEKQLRSSVLGVRSEVCFAPLFHQAPLFGDIHSYMLDHGFELLNLDYTGRGNKAGRFATPDRYGKLISTDAVWVIGNRRLFSAAEPRLTNDVIRFSIFLMLNRASDLAIDVLLRAVGREGVSFDEIRNDALFRALQKQTLLSFKRVLELPMVEKKEVMGAYKAIFGEKFLEFNLFYESEFFT